MALKPWPTDAIIVIAQYKGKEDNRTTMSSVHVACRNCRTTLAASPETIYTAATFPLNEKRPVEFLCPACVELHDVDQIDAIHDERKTYAPHKDTKGYGEG